MGVSICVRLKALAIVFSILILAGLITIQPLPAFARANLTAYTTTPPNTWELKGFNATGTAPWFIVNTLGWNYTKTLGNVGLGNGSLRALNATGNRVINYTEKNYMAADISMAPYDPSRLTTVSVSGINVEEPTSNLTTGEYEAETEGGEQEPTQNSSRVKFRFGTGPDLIRQSSSNEPLCGDYPCTISNRVLPKRDSANQPAKALEKGDNTTGGVGQIGGNIPLNDPYHTILLGRPIDDMVYEHPHGIATNQYGRLVGLQLPGGGLVNIGIRALGYGY